jgi:hypothetical protein
MQMRITTARFKSTCPKTGKTLVKGDRILYDPITKTAYSLDCDFNEITDPQTAEFIQANEDAYFDDFCNKNNI